MVQGFYDQLSLYYKYIFQDWNASVDRQATILDGVIQEYFGDRVHSILDAACGIGTQAIGLAQKGYKLTASDISSGEIEKAKLEASKRNLDIAFRVADMRSLQQTFQTKFDLVIACDNAVPHLLSDDEIRQAFRQFYQVTLESGGCIISVRDYEAMERGGRKFYPRQVHDVPQGKIVIFDCWEFDGDFYDITMYIVEDTGQAVAKTNVIRGGRYYCVSISKLEKLMKEAGFSSVITLKERYFQPLLIGLKV
ncbi:MAG TPA: class I SAM-dependent methyltransferase [Anaerolineales bacterium]|nr:class I SAM-dependent methyltransferase [Anaerolineales bacterium]